MIQGQFIHGTVSVAAAPQKAELVKLGYFAGMDLKEAGQVLGISEPTAVRWWT